MTTENDSEARVREGVVTLAKHLDGPDRRRLAGIEERLLESGRRRSPSSWWWIVLGCGIAAGTAAGYWALHGEGPEDPVMEEERAAPATETQADDTGRADQGSGESSGDARENDGESPIIYMGQ